jgi:hypothetical protein
VEFYGVSMQSRRIAPLLVEADGLLLRQASSVVTGVL